VAQGAAPGDALRRWFGHDPKKWKTFRRHYHAELTDTPVAWHPLLEAARRGDITLLYAARDPEHNNAVALAEFVTVRLGKE